MQPMALLAQPDATKAYGELDVQFPLLDYGAANLRDRISYAYMTVAELNRHLDTIFRQDTNTVRLEIMKALFNNANWTFKDKFHGDLTIKSLANTDGTTYPPVEGSDVEADDNHYLYPGYAAASISDTNNPCKTVRDELEEHFGTPTGGSNIIYLVTPAIADALEGLTDFDPVNPRVVNPGANTDTLMNIPVGTPGRVRGYCDGVWVVEWRNLPANYGIAIDSDVERPLQERVDPIDTGLPQGLNLITETDDHPFRTAIYQHRFGYGVANRLNGVVTQFGTGGSYAVPTGFSR